MRKPFVAAAAAALVALVIVLGVNSQADTPTGGGGGMSRVIHDSTLSGSGTTANPLGVAGGVVGDITGVTAGSNLSGGGTSGSVTVSLAPSVSVTGVTTNVLNLGGSSGYITGTLGSGTTENWAPTGLSTATFVRVVTDTLGSTLGGLDATGKVVGDIVILENHGDGSGSRANGDLKLLHRSAGSSVGNKFVLSDLADVIVPYTGSIILYYDSSTNGWIPLGASQGGRFERATINQLDFPDVEPTALATGNNNNWSPTGIGTHSYVRVTANTGAILTGINPNLPTGAAGYLTGQLKILSNAGSAGILISDEDSNSSAANRISLPFGSFVLAPKQSLVLIYDFTSARWRVFGEPANQSKETLYSQITDTGLGATVNNYNPTGFAYTTRLRLAPAGGSTDLTGLVAQEDGAVRVITSYGAGLTLKHQSASSSSGNKFYLPGSTDLTLAAGCSVTLVDDTAFGSWLAIGVACQAAGDITDVIAGTGLSGGASSGAATLTLSMSGASCSAGQHVSAISATGTGSCTADAGLTGTITSGKIPRATGTSTLGDSSISDTGSVATAGNFQWTVITPTMGGGPFTDWAPTGLPTASDIRANTTTSTCTLDGLSGGGAGRIIFIHNVGSQSLVIANQGAGGSAAANRIITGTGANITVAVDQSVGLVYDGTTTRWRVFGFGNAGTVTSVASGTGLTGGPITSSGTLSVNIAGASCGTNQVMTALGATGTGTCAAPPAFSSSANGYATASGGGTTNFQRADGSWAAPPGTTYSAGTGLSLSTTTFSANLAGASCSSGNAVSAISATGTGTCTAFGPPVVSQAVSFSGTQNDYAGINASTTIVYITGTTTPRLNGWTGGVDGRELLIVNAGAANITFSHQDAGSTAANREVLTVGFGNQQDLVPTCAAKFLYDGSLSRWHQTALSCYHLPGLIADQVLYADAAEGLAFGSGVASTYDGWISKYGYGDSTSQYRNNHFGDGKGVEVAATYGSDRSLRVLSSNVYSVDATPASNKPTVGTCGTSPSVIAGGNFGFRVQVGSGTATSCAITFANSGFLDTPECQVTAQVGSSPAWMPYISAISATAITVSANATGNMAGATLHLSCIGSSINPASP